MRRFVEHFYSWQGEPAVEDKINDYAEKNHLKIITIAPMYGNGIYVLFEESDTAEVAPTADMAEVVRCKDCKFNISNQEKDPLDITDYSGVDIVCSYFSTDGQAPTDFCSRGEKIEGGCYG